MSVKQISVFLENEPGHLYRILNLIENKSINVRGFSASDTGEYGIARFIFDDPDAALQTLKDENMAVDVNEVVCLKLVDKSGELAKVVKIASENDLNVVYCYSLISTYIVFKFSDNDKAISVLNENGISIINQNEISSL